MVFQKTLIDLETKLQIELYIRNCNHPDEYIIQHREELLPNWSLPPKTIIFVFFQCKFPLDGSNLTKE